MLKLLKGLVNNKIFTKQSRKDKDYKLLYYFNDLDVKYIEHKKLSLNYIGKILQLINKIFHSSTIAFENVLWLKLFPLVENIVKKSSVNV